MRHIQLIESQNDEINSKYMQKHDHQLIDIRIVVKIDVTLSDRFMSNSDNKKRMVLLISDNLQQQIKGWFCHSSVVKSI